MTQYDAPPQPAGTGRNRTWLYVLIAALVLCCLCLAGSAVLGGGAFSLLGPAYSATFQVLQTQVAVTPVP